MKKILKTKKMTMVALLSGSLMLAGLGTAIAHQNNYMHRGGYTMGGAEIQLDEKTIELRNKFHDETTDLRKKMITTRTELQAVMNSAPPDSKEAGRLAAELFDIKNQLHQKAEKIGFNTNGRGYGHMGSGGGMMTGQLGGNIDRYCDR